MTDTRPEESPARQEDDIRQIAESGLFDVAWYLSQTDAQFAADDPVHHYLTQGAELSPGPYFDGAWYLRHHGDVRAAGINPLLHYVRYGQYEGRQSRIVVSDRVLAAAERLIADNEAFDLELRAQQLDPHALPYASSFHSQGARAWNTMYSQLRKPYGLVVFSSHTIDTVIPALQECQRRSFLLPAVRQDCLVVTTNLEAPPAQIICRNLDILAPLQVEQHLTEDDLFYIYSALLIALRPRVIVVHDCPVARRLLVKQGTAFARDSALIGILSDTQLETAAQAYVDLIVLRDTLSLYRELYVTSVEVRDATIAALKIPPDLTNRIYVLGGERE